MQLRFDLLLRLVLSDMYHPLPRMIRELCTATTRQGSKRGEPTTRGRARKAISYRVHEPSLVLFLGCVGRAAKELGPESLALLIGKHVSRYRSSRKKRKRRLLWRSVKVVRHYRRTRQRGRRTVVSVYRTPAMVGYFRCGDKDGDENEQVPQDKPWRAWVPDAGTLNGLRPL